MTVSGIDVLVATLGTEPQVVTITHDLLLQMNVDIRQTMVLHTDSDLPALSDALNTLRETFGDRARLVSFEDREMSLITDVTSQAEAVAVLRTIYREVKQLKQNGNRVHLCAAGGRKAMAMYGMLVAQLLFDEDDRLWILISTDRLRLERRLHANPDEASLLRMPVVRWQIDLMARHHFVYDTLTDAERELLIPLAREGLSNRQLAARLYKSEKTIDAQLRAIFAKAADLFQMEKVSRQTVIAEFSPYFLLEDSLGDLIELNQRYS